MVRPLAYAVVLCLALVALSPSASRAAYTDLRSALVRANEEPPNLTQSHYRVYQHFTTLMKVVTHIQGIGLAAASCAVPSSVARDGWEQGIIQSFDSRSAVSGLNLCGVLLRSYGGAHAAYVAEARAMREALQHSRGASLYPMRAIGDESVALRGYQDGLSIGEIILRRHNAVIQTVYLGSTMYPFAQFLGLAISISQRLR